MFRFTIRDVLILTALVAVCVTWLMDRDKIRREREQWVQRERALASENKKWEGEAKRAALRAQEVIDTQHEIAIALLERGFNPQELLSTPIARRKKLGLESRIPNDDPPSLPLSLPDNRP